MRRATLILNEVRLARDEVRQLSENAEGNVTVGLSIAVHLAALPKSLRQFRIRYPSVKLHVIEGLYPTLDEGLRSGRVDFYIGPMPDQLLSPELGSQRVAKIARTVLCRGNHPLIGKKHLRELADADWITTSVTMREEAELITHFRSLDLPPPRLAMRVQSALSLGICVAETDLLAMAPLQWVHSAVINNHLDQIAIVDPLPAPPLVLIRRTDLPLIPAAATLAELLVENFR